VLDGSSEWQAVGDGGDAGGVVTGVVDGGVMDGG